MNFSLFSFSFSFYIVMSPCHSFHECPLRSYSLLIINKEKQTIVTGTDELFDILGYKEPHQLIGKSIHLLNPQKKKDHYVLHHTSSRHIPFEICIHHDPLTNAKDLDYWLIRPLDNRHSNTLGPVTILRLSPFGTIENAYPSVDFPQKHTELQHQPIMSFIHESDLITVCQRLSKTRYKSHHTLRIRWLNHHPRQSTHQTADAFQWVMLTVMNAPRRLSCSSLDDPQSRPICIVRVLYDSPEEAPPPVSINDCLRLACFEAIHLLTSQLSQGTLQLHNWIDSIHAALDQGKAYLLEFIAHLLSYALDFTNELGILYHPPIQECSTKEDDLDMEDMINKKKYKVYSNTTTPMIKVYDNNKQLWSIPLFRKNCYQKL
ncbi:unnamed protein product [Rhizopus microsporus]